jgi:hypothetical protein
MPKGHWISGWLLFVISCLYFFTNNQQQTTNDSTQQFKGSSA